MEEVAFCKSNDKSWSLLNHHALQFFEISDPPGMRRRNDVSFRSRIGRDVADHVETLSWRRNWYVNETDLFETSLRRLMGQ